MTQDAMSAHIAPFLDLLDERSASEVERLGGRRRYRAASAVMVEGDAAGRIGIVRSGLVKLVASHPDGHEAVLGVRGVGDLVGELSLFDSGPRSASVITLVPSEVQVVDGQEFVELVAARPSVAMAVIRTLTGRLRSSDEDRLFLGADGVSRRLARELLQLSETFGVVREDGAIDIDLPFSQDDLAAVVGASRDAVARALRTWRDQGLVATGRRRITLLDPSGLSRRFQF
ncbi:MAG: Crp/Fnr family transcriptional regulator [Microthrixaceae bacterium]|nr:Crp/Fnr family transcriptional regulator [Microthrixaceae bacterium]